MNRMCNTLNMVVRFYGKLNHLALRTGLLPMTVVYIFLPPGCTAWLLKRTLIAQPD